MTHDKANVQASGPVIQKVGMTRNDIELEEALYLGFAPWSPLTVFGKFCSRTSILKSHLILDSSLRLVLCQDEELRL